MESVAVLVVGAVLDYMEVEDEEGSLEGVVDEAAAVVAVMSDKTEKMSPKMWETLPTVRWRYIRCPVLRPANRPAVVTAILENSQELQLILHQAIRSAAQVSVTRAPLIKSTKQQRHQPPLLQDKLPLPTFHP